MESYPVENTHNKVTLQRLSDQIDWYDRKSISCQNKYKILKIIEIIIAASIPTLASFLQIMLLYAALGSAILIIEGVIQINQYHNNWLNYRSTCEELKHEKFLFLAKAGPYSTFEKPEQLLAERIESLISREQAKWITCREFSDSKKL